MSKIVWRVKLTNSFFCSLAIRQAIAKSLVAYYQKCEYTTAFKPSPVIGLFTSEQKNTSTG